MQKLKSIFSNKNTLNILIVLGLIGLGISIFLWYEYSQPHEIGCVAGATNGCEEVRQSEYSYFLGIQLPAWGTLYFVSVVTLLLLGKFKNFMQKHFMLLLGAMLSFAVVFETIMISIQFFVIKSFCVWCTAVEITVVLMFIVFALNRYANRKTKSDAQSETDDADQEDEEEE